MSLSTDNPERTKRILQYANNVMHNEVKKGEIIVVARHSKKDPRKFTIVADSEYDKQLEGIDLIFNDADDFKRIFPDLAKPLPSVLAPGMEMQGESNVAVPLHKDPYVIKNVVSHPEPENPEINGPQNVLDDDDTTQWAVNESPATLLLDLGQDCEIGTLWVKWNQGHTRQFKFIIAVAAENQISRKQGDENSFAIIPHLDEKYSSGTSNMLEPYNLTKDPSILVVARYVMIKVYGNTLNGKWAAINHVELTRAVSIKSRETDKIIERTSDSVAMASGKQNPNFKLPPDKHI